MKQTYSGWEVSNCWDHDIPSRDFKSVDSDWKENHVDDSMCVRWKDVDGRIDVDDGCERWVCF